MADPRQRIIQSVFSRRNAAGSLEETYESHIKIWEDADGGRKPRYILLSQANNGSGFIHKSKLNTNGTFSVGKTWRLSELRTVQVVNPLAFNITLSRTYRWQTENEEDQQNFLQATVRLFRIITAGQVPLQVDGVADYQVSEGDPQASSRRTDRTPLPTNTPTGQGHILQTQASRTASQNNSEFPERNPSPISSRHPNGNPRSESPASSLRERRPPSILVPPHGPSLPSHRTRHPSISASISSHVPSLNSDSHPSRSMQETALSKSRAPTSITNGPSLSSVSDQNARQRADFAPAISEPNTARREHNTRISYFDPANQATLDRLIISNTDAQLDVDGEEENAQATLASVEEMIEGYEWASDDVIGRKMTKGAVDLIEARLLDELMALEKANVHSFLESDDRIDLITKYLDEAISELDNIDGLISTYKIHLNAVGDDILHIQSQNRGLQVQTQNQRALLGELQNLLRTVHVDQDTLDTLTQESLEKAQSIARLEEAASQLYKALQAGRDTDMAATMERLQEYRTHNSQFCKRVFDFLSIMFVAQAKLLLGDSAGVLNSRSRPVAIPHRELELYLERYTGLLLYLREMDEIIYSRLCAAYFSAASELHSTQIKTLLAAHLSLVRRAQDEAQDQGFSPAPTPLSGKTGTMKRAGTLIRSPMEGRQKDREKQTEGDMRASEVFGLFLEQMASLIYKEDEFIIEFLQINNAGYTFADHMCLDNYFRRQAARSASLSQNTLKLIRGSMDLIFGFLPAELKVWLDTALSRDTMEIIGILALLERFLTDAEEKGNTLLLNLLDKQHSRLKVTFERHIKDQLRGIEQTKLSTKRRTGVVSFVKHFLAYVTRVEQQLIGADTLEVRTSVDVAYEKIVQAMFDALKQIAKLEGEGEDKGQLNYHVTLIENMHHLVADISQTDVPSLASSARRAEASYNENLSAYIKIVFRRPFGKLIDHFEGLDRVVKESSDPASGGNFNKTALRKVIKDYTSKDIRKHVDLLYKRVEKHFTDTSEKPTPDEGNGNVATVLTGVWKACEEEFLKLTETFTSRISHWGGDSGISLEYAPADIEAAFRRQKVGP